MKFLPSTTRFLMVASVCGLLAATVSAQQIQINKDNRTIAITATDTANAMADTATVHVGFVAYAADAESAYAKGSKTSNSIMGALTTKGVAKTDIQSESQSVAETQQYELDKLPPAEQAQRRFQVRQTWTVQTKAQGLGIQLGELIYASNQAPENPGPMMMRMIGPGGVVGGTLGSGGSAPPLAIKARKVERSATVYAIFAIQ